MIMWFMLKIKSGGCLVILSHILHRKSMTKILGFDETLEDLDFHLSVCGKYLLISAFIASRNPATLDATLFDSSGELDNRKRRRK